jgi:hypothetical protein
MKNAGAKDNCIFFWENLLYKKYFAWQPGTKFMAGWERSRGVFMHDAQHGEKAFSLHAPAAGKESVLLGTVLLILMRISIIRIYC